MDKKFLLWYLINEKTDNAAIEKVYQQNYSALFIEYKLKNRLNEVTPPGRMKFAFLIHSKEELKSLMNDKKLLERTEAVFISKDDLYESVRKEKVKVGYFIDVDDKAGLDAARDKSKFVDNLLIRFKDPTNIPLELVVAENQNSNCSIMKYIKTSEDGKVSTMTMEEGCDGLVMDTNDINEIVALNNYIDESHIVDLAVEPAVVTRIQHTGMGNRVCIDTTSELYEDEGMILGSTSNGGIVVCSETHYLPYMNLRPFRVNAGGLHLYAWGPDNKAYYLSDLKAGDEIFVVNAKGKARVVTIGRIKIERRPLLLIEAKIGDVIVNTFIQDDWHVRVMGAKGEIRPSSEVKVGDKLLGYKDIPGRHVGIKIDETIKEF